MSAPTPTRLQVALRLGRVSNVPTVWSNVLAGLALGGGELHAPVSLILSLSLTLFYVGGMYLNDAFDARWDAEHRADRPIPAGHVRSGTVFAAGFGMLAMGYGILAWEIRALEVLIAGGALAVLIVAYDAFHKRNPSAPVLMALCRVAVYAIGALTASTTLRPSFFAGAAALLLYLILLSTLARRETLHPKLPRMIGALIAGIALIDAIVLLVTGHPTAAGLAVGAFFLTRHWQRSVPGT
jgi:4-hydroxybenzoate polyprenyltransferase